MCPKVSGVLGSYILTFSIKFRPINFIYIYIYIFFFGKDVCVIVYVIIYLNLTKKFSVYWDVLLNLFIVFFFFLLFVDLI